jgi:hypothetical protein
LGVGQRRGAHVNVPKIGSRGEVLCFGGIQRFYAELRRDFIWGNLKLDFFCALVGDPRELTEEGGQFVCQCMHLGEFYVCWGMGKG